MLALSNIVSKGLRIASNNIFSPILTGLIVVDAFSNATPPPDTIPSCNAAFVAYIASSTRSFFSFSSIFELAPTKTIATDPANIASLCSSFLLI